MAATIPPSPSSPQCPSSPTTDSLQDADKYKMMVLRFSHDTTEEEVDRQFLRTALDLGINVPQDPKATLELVTNNVSALDLNSAPSDLRPPPSRTSNSTHPTSSSSSEPRGHTKSCSTASTSMTSAPSSINSDSSHKSSYTKIKKGMWRFSTLRRRKTIDNTLPPIPLPIAAIKTLRPPPPHRPATADHLPSDSMVRRPAASRKPEASPGPQVHIPSGSPKRRHEDPAARERSLHHPNLKRLRWAQLDEQSRFIRFEADQRRVMDARHAERERRVLNEYPQKVEAAKQRHTEALSSLEHRHLSAEVDLERALEVERQACETRLKHMQAYCNPRSSAGAAVKGMPRRVVTKQHYQQLEQQYHERNGIGNLHASRINVLREKQGKQLERIVAKQEAELKELELALAWKMQQVEAEKRADEAFLGREFEERRGRLEARWALAEAIERKKAEMETGEAFAELEPIEWGDDTAGRGNRGKGEEEDAMSYDGDLARDARMAYDASSFNVF